VAQIQKGEKIENKPQDRSSGLGLPIPYRPAEQTGREMKSQGGCQPKKDPDRCFRKQADKQSILRQAEKPGTIEKSMVSQRGQKGEKYQKREKPEPVQPGLAGSLKNLTRPE
jgi:hypothetical protein